LQKEHDPRCQKAAELVKTLPLIISNQVLNEYYSVMLKNKVNRCIYSGEYQSHALGIVMCFVLRLKRWWRLFLCGKRYRFSWWDSLIVASALETQCDALYTEDLQHGQVIENTLQIINPFLEEYRS